MHPIIDRLRALPLVATLLLASGAAVAKPPVDEPDNLLNDRFYLQAGLMSSSNQTHARVDAPDGTLGTDVDGERDLGLPTRKLVGRAELMFRMRDRHRIRLGNSFIPLDRHATTVLKSAFQFGNTTYLVNETVSSELKLRLFMMNYTYSFVKNERVELGASIGVDMIGFEAQASIPARLRDERRDYSAPAPLIGVEGAGRLSNRFYLEGRAQFLKVRVGTVRGTLTTYEGNLLYRLMPNVNFGLGVASFNINIDSRKVGDSGAFELKSTGPQLFARVGF